MSAADEYLRRDEFDHLAIAVVQRLREGSLPPDDAYHWTRIVCEMARRVPPKEPLNPMFTNSPIVKIAVLVAAVVAAA